ncbi:hypothetical protein FBU30_002054, partial [Linnemannia zychae]
MEPSQPHADQYSQQPPLTNGLRVAPPIADGEDHPSPKIPGINRLEEAVGKAIGGTVITSDIPVSDLPSTDKLDASLAGQKPVSPPSSPQQQAAVPSSASDEKAIPANMQNGVIGKETSTNGVVIKDPVPDIPGKLPQKSRVGWLEAYKRNDGPSNEFRDKSIWMEEFASSALYGSFWHNAAALVVIPVVCYICFKLGAGFVTLVIIIAFGSTYYKNSIRRFRRNARDDITRELIRNALEDDAETTEWINNFLSKFWLIYEPVLSATVVQTVDSILVDQTPAFLDSIRLTTFTLGTKAPRVESVKAFPKTDPDVVVMDWRVSFTPTDIEDMTPRQLRTQINPKICLTIRVGKGVIGAGMPILVEDMSFRGYMRFKLKLTSNFPHIKTVDFCFLEPPTIDYVLKPVGGETFGMDIAHIPGLHSFIRDQTHAILGPMMYAPNVYTLDLEQMMTGGASLTAAAGVVQFTIYNAKDLKNTELVGNSDPYVKIRLGNRPELATTAVKSDTLNPIWNETNTILVNNLNEVICMEIFDKDSVRKDRPLGQANFDLKSLEDNPIQDDVWCKVLRNGKERGGIRIRAAYFPVQHPQPSADGKELVPVQSKSGILALNLAQAKDIARTGKTKSLCKVYLNGRLAHTTKKMHGANPAWGSEIDLFITDLESAQVKVDIISEDNVIGTYGVACSKLLKDTTDNAEWVSLQGGEGTGKLKLSGIWKPILMDDNFSPGLHKTPFGVLRIQVLKGRDLRNVEIGGSSDPYIVITGERGMGRGKTKVIDSNLNPVWNEIHYVAVNSMKQHFEFECFDYQKVTKDRTLGKTTFQVDEVVEELPNNAGYVARPTINRWAPLKQKDGSTKGELNYEISFFPTLRLAKEATKVEEAAGSLSSAKNSVVEVVNTTDEPSPSNMANPDTAAVEAAAGTLPPNTIYASEALDFDSGILVTHLIGAELDRSNTYCEFYVDSDCYQFKSVTQKSRNPKWNEIADIFVKELEYAKLVIHVKEKSSMEKDPTIGIFSSNIQSLLEGTPAEGGNFPIMDRSERGSLHMKFEYLPVPIELLPRERLDNMGNMTVSLVRAKNLIPADRSGASDPYIVFKVNGKEVHKSDVVKKTLNPEYNETFVVPISSRADDQFTFEVFDWNQLSTAKSLGVGSLDLRTIQLVLPNEFLIPLQNKQNQGEVQLRIRFIPEFLSSNKAKTSLGATFISGGVGVVTGGVGAVAGGVEALGQGAVDVTGAVGKGALKGVGAVGKVFGLSKSSRTSGESPSTTPEVPNLSTPMMPNTPSTPEMNPIRPSNSDASLNVSPPLPRTSVGSIRSRTSMVFDSNDIVGEPGNLTIHVIEAKEIAGVDKSGTSDPYVKVSVGNKTVLKTKVKKENLSPIWNESAVVPGLTGHPVTINFLVRDHNTLGSDKDLGEFDLRLWEYIQPASEAHPGEYRADFWAPLNGSGGKLHLLIEYEPSHDSESSQKKRGLFS